MLINGIKYIKYTPEWNKTCVVWRAEKTFNEKLSVYYEQAFNAFDKNFEKTIYNSALPPTEFITIAENAIQNKYGVHNAR